MAKDPSSRKKRRLLIAMSAALLLAGALVYTSFSSASSARSPSQLLASAQPGRSYDVSGKVLPGYTRSGDQLRFRVRDRTGRGSVSVLYRGAVPDPFRAGREVIVTVTRQGGEFIGRRDSLITKCPSKFSAAPPRA